MIRRWRWRMAVFMFSLAGIPLMSGFFAKLYIFLASIQAGLLALAIIGVLTSVVGAFYYIRIVKVMYFDAAAERVRPTPGLTVVRGGRNRLVHGLLLCVPGARGGGSAGGSECVVPGRVGRRRVASRFDKPKAGGENNVLSERERRCPIQKQGSRSRASVLLAWA